MESDSIPPSEPLMQIAWLIFMQLAEINAQTLVFQIVTIIVLLFLSALISGSEVAFFSISPAQLQELKESDLPEDKKVLNLLERPRLLLASVLISNNFVNISIIILLNFVLISLFPAMDKELVALLNVFILTPPLVFFGEVSPKVFASMNNLLIARKTAGIFQNLRFITFPIGILLVKSGLFIERRFEKANHEIDLEEIEKAIELSTNDGSTIEDVNILKGIVHFGNTTVKQIMVPRVDIVAVRFSYSFKDILNLVKEAGYSRMPVFKDSIDKIEGILYLKDLLEHIDKGDDYEWQELVREPFFVPETKKIDDLLREIQSNRKHQVIVVDEYGGTKGMVTLEDILEEVLGDIKDEFDEVMDNSYKRINSNTALFDAKISLSDLCEIMDIDEDEFEDVKGESDTLAGLILELSGALPKKGKEIQYHSYTFTVLSMERNRINRVKLSIKND